MIRMEIALFMVLGVLALMYFSAGRHNTLLHRVYSVLLVVVMCHMVFDGITVYTVNRLDTVAPWLNELVHRLFIGTMILSVYLFYLYIAILVEEETGKKRSFDRLAWIFLVAAEICNGILPIHYAQTPQGNYSDGIHVYVCYAAVVFFALLCVVQVTTNWKQIIHKKRRAIAAALAVEVTCCIAQAFNPTWLISGMGLTLMTLAFYLTMENPDSLRAELVEQKMSMLYLKNQVNPHFLYNTLDTIRIQAQLNGDKRVAELLMRLVDFFRLSCKVNEPMVELDSELDMIEAYLELMCSRYPELVCHYEIEPELCDAYVPNFILQPLVENSLLHGLKKKGYKGEITVRVQTTHNRNIEIQIVDTGAGFAPDRKAEIDQMLTHYARQIPKLEGNSIGILNVQKRIKLLCGRDFGLWYTNNEEGGATAHIYLPLILDPEEMQQVT